MGHKARSHNRPLALVPVRLVQYVQSLCSAWKDEQLRRRPARQGLRRRHGETPSRHVGDGQARRRRGLRGLTVESLASAGKKVGREALGPRSPPRTSRCRFPRRRRQRSGWRRCLIRIRRRWCRRQCPVGGLRDQQAVGVERELGLVVGGQGQSPDGDPDEVRWSIEYFVAVEVEVSIGTPGVPPHAELSSAVPGIDDCQTGRDGGRGAVRGHLIGRDQVLRHHARRQREGFYRPSDRHGPCHDGPARRPVRRSHPVNWVSILPL